jgi:sterol desaturase/sphingolipid hydroxylase (fatty acid hydroxylase superfamily)
MYPVGKHVREDGFIEYSGVYWTLALPSVVISVNLSIVAALLFWASRRPGGRWTALLPGVMLGLAAWTLFEYAFHRWLLHHSRYRLLRELFWKRLHAEHHGYRRMRDPEHRAVHPLITLPVAGALVGTIRLTMVSAWGPAILAGWLLGYCLYEALHWLFHSGVPFAGMGRVPFFRGLWEAHTVHHLQAITANYGFIGMFWDRRFGTYQPLASARLERG